MKKSFNCKTTVVAMVVTSSLVGIPFCRASDESFEISCGSETRTLRKLSIDADFFGQNSLGDLLQAGCSINQIQNANIGLYCTNSADLEESETRGYDHSRRRVGYHLIHKSISSDGGQIAQSRILIKKEANELVITLDNNYNTEFASQDKVYIPDDRIDGSCEILPFNWDYSQGGCY